MASDESPPQEVTQDVGWKERTRIWRSSTLYIAITASWSVFMDNLCFGAALPVYAFALEARLNVSESDVQAYISGLIATEGVAILLLSPMLGYFLDRVQHLRFFLLVGFGIQILSLVLHLVGTHVALLFAGRLLQGLSSAMLWICGSAMVVKASARKDTGRFLGLLTFAQSGGTFLGPIVGGGIYAAREYRAVFACLLGLMSIDLLLRGFLIERDVRRPEAGVVQRLPSSAPPESSHEAGAAYGAVAPAVENSEGSQKPKPLMVQMLRSPRIVTALYGAFALVSLDTSIDAILSLFVKDTFHWNSTASGLIFLCLFVPDLFSPLVGWLSDRLGVVYLAVPSFLAMTPLFVCLRFVATSELRDKVLLAALITLVGFGLTGAETPLLAELDHAMTDELESGEQHTEARIYALYMTAYGLGQVVGPLVAGLLHTYAGWNVAVAVLGGWSGLTALPILVWMRRRPETEADSINT